MNNPLPVDGVDSSSALFGERYHLLDQLGTGGMGTVYRVHDRLAGETVALKCVHAPPQNTAFTPTEALHQNHITSDPRVTLAREFQAMSTLRHPHILAVLDYGFEKGQPYFTMELLENAQTILEYGRQRSLESQVQLLVQVLLALKYLHRRGMIHRDLKPGNVLVTEGVVKVLDFGLSMATHQATGTMGTLAYMPPEVLYGNPAGPASDLYAVGVMAYELMTGRHPFISPDLLDSSPLTHLIDPQIKLDTAPLPPALAPIMERMLARHIEDRYQDAQEIINAFNTATGRTYAPENEAARESFLQAAQFVGRKQELRRLRQALDDAFDHQGSGWLIGGESGVGKSRLVDELRTLALVRGALVLRSAAISSGGGPYLIWRDLLRWLVLLTPVSDLEASVLQVLVPDIGDLLARPIPPSPIVLNPADARTRLFSIVTDILHRQTRPVVIILEDLQWAALESLQLLAWINRKVSDYPLVLIGNYRHEERPDLPHHLPLMQPIYLQRLDNGEIVLLSESMLGPNGRNEAILSLLRKETEGNPFFLVEVVRALAEEAGHLDNVGKKTLPSRVFTGGLQQLIHRRLSCIPAGDRDLLQLAAVSGRRLDLAVLHALSPDTNLDQWLTTGANAAVLEVQDDRWQFAHDKLREGVLANLTDGQEKALHQQIAQAVEDVYGDTPQMAASLAHHWGAAENKSKEKYYAAIAGRAALHSGANQEAIHYLERALALDRQSNLPADAKSRLWRAQVTRRLGEAYLGLGRMAESRRYLEQTLSLTRHPVRPDGLALTISMVHQLGLQILHRFRSRRVNARIDTGKKDLLMEAVRANQMIAEIYYFASQKIRLVNAGLKTLNYAENAGPSSELARAYGNMSIISGLVPLERVAETYVQLALETAQAVNDLPAQAWAYVTASVYTVGRGQWDRSLELIAQAVDLCRRTADKRTLGLTLGSYSLIPYHRGRFEDAIAVNAEWAENAQRINNFQHHIFGLTGQAECLLRLDRLAEAEDKLRECDALWTGREAETVDDAARFRQLGVWALLHLQQGQADQARETAQEAMKHIGDVASASQAIMGDGVVDIAEVFLTLWAADRQLLTEKEQKATAEICRVLGNYARPFIILQPRALLWQGEYARLRGKPRAAKRKWSKGLTIAQAYEMQFDQACLRSRLDQEMAD
jgi:tetratricopeptide (TPR) repeat protein